MGLVIQYLYEIKGDVLMTAIIGILSLLGFIVCIIMTVINAIRKKPVKQAALGIAVCFVVFAVAVAITPADDSNNVNTVETNHAVDVVEVTETTKHTEVVATTEPVQIETTVEAVPTVEYDALQKVFIGFTLDTTQEDVMNLINEYGLEYSSQKYNGTPKSIQYKIAFDKGVTPQKYADEGDHIEVSFNVADGTLLHAEYFNLKAFKTAVLYGYGTYWDFRSDEPNNQYSGHYYHKPGDAKGGITIKYSNGRSSETGYHQATSAEDALLNVLT